MHNDDVNTRNIHTLHAGLVKQREQISEQQAKIDTLEGILAPMQAELQQLKQQVIVLQAINRGGGPTG